MERNMYEEIFQEEMEGLRLGRVVRQKEYDMEQNHIHNEYEIYYLLEGERYYFIGTKTYFIKKGALVLIDRRQIHRTVHAGNPYHDRILMELKNDPFRLFFEAASELSLTDFFRKYNGVVELNEEEQKMAADLLLGMAAEMRERKMGYRTKVFADLAKLLVFAGRKLQQGFPGSMENTSKMQHRKVDEVAEYISSHYAEVSSLEEVAQKFYISKSYLSRIFRQVTGFTVNEYINLNRIREAQNLLVQTDKSITEIAEILGYESITYFERVFKRYTEITPGKCRKQAGEKTRI